MGIMQGYLSAKESIASTRLKEQMAQENEMNLDEQRRVFEENVKARDIQTQAYNAPQEYKTLEIPNATPAAVAPQGLVPTQATPQLIPQAGATGLGGMTIPQQAPVGMQPTENLGGMQPIAPVGMAQQPAPVQPAAPTGVQQTTETAPATIMNKVQESAKTVRVAESEIQKVQRVADELHKAGLHDQANVYLEKQTGLIKNVENAKKVHLENTVAMADRAASLGDSYIEAIKNGSDPNAAWAELLIKASADGYPIESLLTVVDPKERMAKAEEIVNNAETTKQRSQMALELSKQESKAKLQEGLTALRIKLSADKTASSAASQAAIKDRFDKTQGLAVYKTQVANVKNLINTAKDQRDDYDQQIRDIDLKIRDIDTLAIPLKKDEKEARLATYNDARNELQSARNTADKQLKELDGHLSTLQDSFGKSGLKDDPAKETVTKPKAVDIDAVRSGAEQAIKNGADPVKVAARYKEVTGQEYEAKPGVASEATLVEIPAIKYITTQGDLDKAIKAKLLKPNEIKAAKEKIKALSLQNKETKANQTEQDRIKKIQETTLKSSPLAPFTL